MLNADILYILFQNATHALVGIYGGEMPNLPLAKHAMANIRMQGIYTGSKKQLRDLFALWIEHKVSTCPV